MCIVMIVAGGVAVQTNMKSPNTLGHLWLVLNLMRLSQDHACVPAMLTIYWKA